MKLVLFALAFMILMSIVYAETWFTIQPDKIYSIGDELRTSISVSEASKEINAKLVCDGQEKLMFLSYLGNDSRQINIFQPLSKEFLGEMKGDCKIIASYNGLSDESESFEISDEVSVTAGTNNKEYNPGNSISVSGSAQKANSQPLNGFLEIKIDALNLSTSGVVQSGNFNVNITIPEKTNAGDYSIRIRAYEKKEEQITNQGEITAGITVKQMPKSIEIALKSQEIMPGDSLNFYSQFYDQSENKIDEDYSFSIEDSNNGVLAKGLLKTGESYSLPIEKNLTSGYYKIKVSAEGLYQEREFFVKENEEAEFLLVEGILYIKNIGNVKYQKAVQIKIGDKVEIINPILELGEELKYQISAPEGQYNIEVSDGETSAPLGYVTLTGNSINVRESGKNYFSSNKALAWIFLVFVLGMFVFLAARKTLKKRFVLSDRFFDPYAKKRINAKDKGMIVVAKTPKEAEHTLVLRGQKQDAPMVCLKIKNEITKAAKLNLDNTIERIFDNKGAVYKAPGFIIPIFSPLVTRTFKNHIPAIKAALELAKALNEYNNKFKDKIEYGISVHTGDIVNRVEEDKLKFTSLGNTITFAKKLADISQKEVLLSKEIHEKTLSEVKADRVTKQGFDVFTVNRITDTAQNEKFIGEFLKRQAQNNKKF